MKAIGLPISLSNEEEKNIHRPAKICVSKTVIIHLNSIVFSPLLPSR